MPNNIALIGLQPKKDTRLNFNLQHVTYAVHHEYVDESASKEKTGVVQSKWRTTFHFIGGGSFTMDNFGPKEMQHVMQMQAKHATQQFVEEEKIRLQLAHEYNQANRNAMNLDPKKIRVPGS